MSCNYEAAKALLTSQGKFYIKLGLERVQELLEYFDNPQDKIKCIHVAGTNGKGSTCAMLESILREAGYKTGLYTSPHIYEYTERIKINGQDISQDEFAGLVFKVINIGEKLDIPATEFEILTVAAFVYFCEQGVDYAVMETGLGGRLDATNTIKNPVVTIITSIDIDHADRLGSTIEQIAYEKAGIIKANIPIITMKNNKGLEIIEKTALEKNSFLFLAEKTDIETNLMGLWQKENASLAIKAAELLGIPGQAIKNGLNKVKWPARFEYIKDKNIIIDAAHNPAGARALRQSLDFYFPSQKRVFLFSCLNTKDYKEITKQLFRKEDTVILTKAFGSSAGLSPEKIRENLHCCKIYITDNVSEAVDLLEKFSECGIIRVIAGSIYTIGEIYLNG